MDREDFIIHVYCIISKFFDSLTKSKSIRQRGPRPHLADDEIITMQVVGEFLGMDGEKNIWEYFSKNWIHFFPGLGDRTTFVKQVGNLEYWIRRLHSTIAAELSANSDTIHITDGFPAPVTKFKRAHFSKVFKGYAEYGYCAAKGEIYYGFKGHIVINSIGVVSHFCFAAANIDERDVLPENVDGISGKILGDKGLIRPSLTEMLARQGVELEHPLRENMKESRTPRYLSMLKNQRRLVETVIGQLNDRFNIEKVRARTTWRLGLRFMRKILAHTIGIYLNSLLGRPLLQLEGLVG
jgi:hypothetical protein